MNNCSAVIYVQEELFSSAIRDFCDWNYIRGYWRGWIERDEVINILQRLCKGNRELSVRFNEQGAYIERARP